MMYKTRFSLIGLGIIIFLIATPLLVLYARGFIIDWHTYKIVKTGAIVVKTDPSNATVFLNGKQQKNLTPTNIRFLAPADYDIRVEKIGYQSWTKRLSVFAQLVTWTNSTRDFVTLFLQTPKLNQSWNISASSLSKTGTEIAFLDANQQVSSINTATGNVAVLGSINGIKFPQISPTVDVNWENATQVFKMMQSRGTWGLTDKQILSVSKAQSNGMHTATKLDSDLYSLDTASPSLIDHNVLTFDLDGNDIWYVQGNLLKRYSYSTGNTEIINQNVPSAQNGKIIRSETQIYLILDQKLYVLNDTFEKIYDNVTQASWDSVSKQLFFSNNNEILMYDPDSTNTDLILRSSNSIKNPLLNSETGYVFFASGNEIKAIELDGRDHRNTYAIANLPDSNSSFVLSPDGKTLYTISDTKIDSYTIR